jgi:hypothetical protein
LTDNTESVSYLLNQPIACVRLNRYIIEYTQQDAKYENEDSLSGVKTRIDLHVAPFYDNFLPAFVIVFHNNFWVMLFNFVYHPIFVYTGI